MPNGWNEPLPKMDQQMCDRMIAKTNEYLSLIQWRNNGQPRDLKHAVELAKAGLDGGLDATLQLRPTSRDFNDWMYWNDVITFLVNRDNDFKTLLSAIRNAITQIIHVCTNCIAFYYSYYMSHISRRNYDGSCSCSYNCSLVTFHYGLP